MGSVGEPTPEGEPAPAAGGAKPARRESDEHLSELAQKFEVAIQGGDPAEAEAIAEEAVQEGLEVEQIYSHVIAPAMRRIGQLWQQGDVSVACEHLATAVSQGVMARLFPRLLQGEQRSRELVMLAATQGEHHVLGLRMIADCLEGAGYDVRYLGADVPLEALLEACRDHPPAVLGLTASMGLNVPTMIWEIREIAKLEQAPAVMVGGRAVGRAVAEGLDAPVAESCEDAVEIVGRLIDGVDTRPPVRPSLAARVPPGPSTSEIAGGRDAGVAAMFSATSLAAADTARHSARQAFKLGELAYRDSLTGLWNRRAYDDRVAELSAESTPHCAALMLDVDRFKTINDTYGHEAGDEALIAVGRAILKSIRPADFGARFGGDEFAVLLPGMSSEEATGVAERIRATVERDLSDPPVSVSIGVADLSGDARKTNLSVDGALYEAKRAGRNQVACAGA
jgi:diguanylate cyclase (GGDEF)-like protein